ncbi:hypothetical protein BJF79_13190 [Actinomadura sp. CNU-125]|uniref:ATP-binding protein n=1 Tax=Actinomadura sp. CNU-125 TaxID=1904961 RepID=UPI0009624405|nr:hypothetical protein [Actinomadura sp. CNU-125]OLT24706.1 hypothetical protein BJF79_13190 [Actinomadura sp. CNU-125]
MELDHDDAVPSAAQADPPPGEDGDRAPSVGGATGDRAAEPASESGGPGGEPVDGPVGEDDLGRRRRRARRGDPPGRWPSLRALRAPHPPRCPPRRPLLRLRAPQRPQPALRRRDAEQDAPLRTLREETALLDPLVQALTERSAALRQTLDGAVHDALKRAEDTQREATEARRAANESDARARRADERADQANAKAQAAAADRDEKVGDAERHADRARRDADTPGKKRAAPPRPARAPKNAPRPSSTCATPPSRPPPKPGKHTRTPPHSWVKHRLNYGGSPTNSRPPRPNATAPAPTWTTRGCEHVLDAAAALVGELLGTCPGLRVLATSRERLGLDGEALCPVPPLDGAAAVRLFAERAASVRPGFVADAEVAGEICRRLDGLPLAIELAAARLRAMTSEQLVRRLDGRFRLLTGGSRTALPRHRTLRAVVAWSWDLLDERERGFAERLAVFPGTIAPEAAERVGGGTLDDLDALADRSLLQAVEGREPRFRMLETIREYARERLAERGELARVQAAHLAYFLELAERAEPHLLRAEQVGWLPLLSDGQDDLLAALRFAEESGDAGSAVRLGAALAVFWTIQGDHAEAARRLRGALAVPRRTPVPDGAEAAALGGYVLSTWLSGGGARDDPLIEARPPGTRPLAVLIEPGRGAAARRRRRRRGHRPAAARTGRLDARDAARHGRDAAGERGRHAGRAPGPGRGRRGVPGER